jgi:hypothetical protein
VPVEPGKPTEFPVHVWATHWRFAKGHSIRLSVSSGDLPRIEPDAPAGTVDVLTGAGGSYADLSVLGAAPAAASEVPAPAEETASTPATTTSSTAPQSVPLAKPKHCVKGRRLKLRLRARRGDPLVSAQVIVNGGRAKRLAGRALRRPGRVRLTRRVTRVKLIARTRAGRRVTITRKYRRCS